MKDKTILKLIKVSRILTVLIAITILATVITYIFGMMITSIKIASLVTIIFIQIGFAALIIAKSIIDKIIDKEIDKFNHN